MTAGGVRVAGPSFEIRVDDQADCVFPGRNPLVGVMEVFGRVAVVIMVVFLVMVVIKIGRIQLPQIAFAEGDARVGFVFFVFQFVEPAADRFVVVAQRAGRTSLA